MLVPAPSTTDFGLLAYALMQSAGPQDTRAFRRLAMLYGHLGGLTAAGFLVHYETEIDRPILGVYPFVTRTAPELIHQLRRTTQPQRVHLNGRARGRVDWAHTYKTRCTEDNNPAVFVCVQSGRRFDLPENQLLKFMLHRLEQCIGTIPPALRSWVATGPAVPPDLQRPLLLDSYLALLSHRLRILTAHRALSEVTLPNAIDQRHLAAAWTSTNRLYASVADLYQQYLEGVHHPAWSTWTRTLRRTLLLPASVLAVRQSLLGAGRP